MAKFDPGMNSEQLAVVGRDNHPPITDSNEWHFWVRPARAGGYVAWAAKTPELGEAPSDVPRGVVVLFLFDDGEDEALRRLKQEVAMEGP